MVSSHSEPTLDPLCLQLYKRWAVSKVHIDFAVSNTDLISNQYQLLNVQKVIHAVREWEQDQAKEEEETAGYTDGWRNEGKYTDCFILTTVGLCSMPN